MLLSKIQYKTGKLCCGESVNSPQHNYTLSMLLDCVFMAPLHSIYCFNMETMLNMLQRWLEQVLRTLQRVLTISLLGVCVALALWVTVILTAVNPRLQSSKKKQAANVSAPPFKPTGWKCLMFKRYKKKKEVTQKCTFVLGLFFMLWPNLFSFL